MIISAAGPAIEKSVKPLIPPILANFSDNKKGVRDITAESLNVWATEFTLDPFIPYLAQPLVEAPACRKDMLGWMAKHMANSLKTRPKMDVSSLVKPLIGCLEDKSADVRHSAEALLKDILPSVGYENIKRQCGDLKPASKLVVGPILESMRPSSTAPTDAKADDKVKST